MRFGVPPIDTHLPHGHFAPSPPLNPQCTARSLAGGSRVNQSAASRQVLLTFITRGPNSVSPLDVPTCDAHALKIRYKPRQGRNSRSGSPQHHLGHGHSKRRPMQILQAGLARKSDYFSRMSGA